MSKSGTDSMGFRDLLLCVDPVTPESTLIDNAVTFAKRRNASLLGLYAMEFPELPGYVRAQLPKEIIEQNRQYFSDLAAKAEAAFRETCTAAGIEFEWRCVEGNRADLVVGYGRLADLVLVGSARNSGEPPTGESTGQILLECGRPVLLLPPAPMAEQTGSRILLAWNGRREAVRAVHDALPLLSQAEWVKVLAVNPDASATDYGELPGSELCRHLARHGVNAEAREVRARGKSDGAALLEAAKEENANLIVMGAYGHRRWRELVIGGVTAHVLRHADLPVLLSH